MFLLFNFFNPPIYYAPQYISITCVIESDIFILFFHETRLSWFLCYSSGFLLVSVRSVRSHLMVSLVLSAESKASLALLSALWVLVAIDWLDRGETSGV